MALSCRRGPNAHYPGGHLARTPLEGSIRSFRSPRSPPLDTAAMVRHACVANTPSWKLHAGDPFYFHQFTRPEPRPKKAGPEIIRIYRRNPTVDTGAHFLIKQLIWKARGTHFKFIFFVISSSKPQALYIYLDVASTDGHVFYAKEGLKRIVVIVGIGAFQLVSTSRINQSLCLAGRLWLTESTVILLLL